MNHFNDNSEMDLNYTGSDSPIENQPQQTVEISQADNPLDKKNVNKTHKSTNGNATERQSGGIAGTDVDEQKIVEPSEEELDEKKNNLRDAFNDDEYTGTDDDEKED